MEKLKLAIPIVLSGIDDEKDQCVERLRETLSAVRGVEQVHTDTAQTPPMLCLHYDPNLATTRQLQRIVQETGAQIVERFHHETLEINGMDCTDCGLVIEHSVGRLKGMVNVSVNYAAQKMRVEYDAKEVTREAIVQRVQYLGYTIVEPEKEKTWFEKNKDLMFSLASGALLLAGWLGGKYGFPETVSLVLYLLAYLAGGYEITLHAVKALFRFKFDIDVLMVVAAAGAAVLGEWLDGALLLFLFSLGHALEKYAMGKARAAIRALGKIAPKTALVRRAQKEMSLPLSDLLLDDLVIVKPGEKIPVDGEILGGASAVDQAPITGESMPVEKQKGDKVFAGTINGEGALDVRVTKLAKDSTLARVVQLVEEAQTQKSPTQQFTDRFERVFVPVVLIGVLLLIAIPPLFGFSLAEAFYRAMTVLVAASPCALAIATPSAVLAAVARAAQTGVLIKGGVHLENLGALDAIAFDKTGTITKGAPEVTDVVVMGGWTERDLLKIIAAIESRSNHPLAKSIVAFAAQKGIAWDEASAVESINGKGMRGQVQDQSVLIGNLLLMRDANITIPAAAESQKQSLEQDGKTTMLIEVNGTMAGIIALADPMRREAPAMIANVKRIGIKRTIMLTGDNVTIARVMAQRAGLDEYNGDLLPEDKAAAVRKLAQTYGKIAMVGDGVNDAPAMANATVGIAMGGAGTDVALETADVALMGDDLSKIPFAVGLSRQSRRIIRQNVIIALGVIAILIPSALFGWTRIGIAVLFHEGSTLVVVANALRLLRYKMQ